jgi:hypothetical protein
MASDALNCSGCRDNLPSQRDHRCLVGGAREEVLPLFRLSPETIRKERALREMHMPTTTAQQEAKDTTTDVPYCAGCAEEQPSITDHSCMGF